ncbi:MAG: hypothetical protein NTY77_15795 [Elusimicrobia bacterium]|nr:hypothetical protein [Elusimicrobiota bacterium]
MRVTPRLLFLEFLCRYEERCETSMTYPFLKGLARDLGVPARWLYFVVTPNICWEKPAGRVLRADLPGPELALLRGQVEEFRPTHIVVNEIPAPGLRRALRAARGAKLLVLPSEWDTEAFHWGEQDDPGMGPYLSLVGRARRNELQRPGWFLDWLGAGGHPRAQAHLFDAAEPDYEATAGGAAGAGDTDFPLILVGGRSCKGRPSVAGNPRFRGLDAARLARGCSFCGGSIEENPRDGHRRDSLALAELQLRRHEATDPGRRRSRATFIVHDLGLFFKMDEFFAMVRRNGFRPGLFIFCPRIDDVLGARERIEAVLPVAAAGGHRLRLEIMGIENFSPEVMELYNKKVTVAQVDELIALMDRWNKGWPGVFSLFKGGKNWLMLLFTPWTTLAELRVNFTEAARRGFAGEQLWICSSLLLRKGTALEALAKREGGIIVPEFEDRGLLFFPALGIRMLWGSTPWRFKDPKVADFFRVLVRVFAAVEHGDARPLFRGDPEFDLLHRIYCDAPEGAPPPQRRPPWSLLDVALEMIRLLEASPAPPSREELLRTAVARVKEKSPPPPPPEAAGQGPGGAGLSGPEAVGALGRLERTAIDDVSRLLKTRGAPQLGRLAITAAGSLPGSGLRLSLLMDGREMVISLLGRRSPESAFFTSRLFKVIYWSETPPRTPEQTRRLRLLVALIEGRLQALRARAPRTRQPRSRRAA